MVKVEFHDNLNLFKDNWEVINEMFFLMFLISKLFLMLQQYSCKHQFPLKLSFSLICHTATYYILVFYIYSAYVLK